MYTLCTIIQMIKTCTGCIYTTTFHVVLETILQGHLTDSREAKSQIFCGNLEWEPCFQSSCHADPSPPGSCFILIVCAEPCDPLFGLLFHYLSILPALEFQAKKKEKREPSVRCYKLLARPAARPRDPDLAAPRLRRVKRCTQRGSLHLYAPYIGRLLLQPTGK